MRSLRGSSKGYAAIEIIIYSVLPLMVFSLVPGGFQAIQKQLAAESMVRMVARDLMISKAENPQSEVARLAGSISKEYGLDANVRSSCVFQCGEDGGWYELILTIDGAIAKKVAVIEK